MRGQKEYKCRIIHTSKVMEKMACALLSLCLSRNKSEHICSRDDIHNNVTIITFFCGLRKDMCFVEISSRFAQSYVCNKFINIPLSRKLHNPHSLIFPESSSFLAASTHQNPQVSLAKLLHSIFVSVLNFPFNASSCNLSQRDASSRTLSQNK